MKILNKRENVYSHSKQDPRISLLKASIWEIRYRGLIAFICKLSSFVEFRVILAFLFVLNKFHKRSFKYNNQRLHYFYNLYNVTWMNERCVEIPIIQSYVKKFKNKKILEVGNVSSHYFDVDWDVLDKFEEGYGVINEDICTFKPKQKYDLVIATSTLEHVGFDDDTLDSKKILQAIRNIKCNCLKKGGMLIATIPLGYNMHMDRYFYQNKLGFDKVDYMKRISKTNIWVESEKKDVLGSKYNSPYPFANGLLVGVLSQN